MHPKHQGPRIRQHLPVLPNLPFLPTVLIIAIFPLVSTPIRNYYLYENQEDTTKNHFGKGFWGEAGLAYGYLFNFSEEDDFGELPNPFPFNKSELSALIGVAYNIPKTGLRVNVRATNSVFPVRQLQNKVAYYVDASAKGQYNRGLEFALAWFFK